MAGELNVRSELMKRHRVLLALVPLALAGIGMVAWRERTVRAQAPATPSPAAAHAHHVPPQERGSGIYQYAHPTQRAFAAGQVYDPVLPPITPAPNGVREFKLVVEENIEHEVAPGGKIPAWTFNRTVP